MNENTNAATNVTSTSTELAPASLPSKCVEIRGGAKGHIMARQYSFGTGSASELKAELKATGLKGKALTRAVNEALANDKANRHIMLAAAVAHLENLGFVADRVKVGASEKSATVAFIKPAEVKPAKEEEKAKKLEAALDTLGQSLAKLIPADKRAELEAMLAAVKAA